MVLPHAPAKFYGTSLPRPRFYTDVKLSNERVDPPLSVLDPLLSWAGEAHWSFGGLSFNRVRFQGKVEGNLGKLRNEEEEEEIRDGGETRRKRRRLVRKLGSEIEFVGDENGKSLSDGGDSCCVASTTRRRSMVLMEEE